MLKKIRVIIAVLFLIGITLLFIGIGPNWLGWMAKLQFLPSLLALNFAVIIGVVLITLLFGRIYCSVICPMGIFQDLVIWIRRKGEKLFKNKKPTSSSLSASTSGCATAFLYSLSCRCLPAARCSLP